VMLEAPGETKTVGVVLVIITEPELPVAPK
jgi:hypothetical protein